jgi:hypothetical protein
MRGAVDYAERAEECRRLAKLCKRPEEWGHLLEMAETWEMLLRHQQFETYYFSQTLRRKRRRKLITTKRPRELALL